MLREISEGELMTKRSTITTVALFVLLAACQAALQPADEIQHIRLPMGYIPNIQYAPFYVAIERGYFAEAGFEVEFDYSFETDGVALVGAGEVPFALVSGEQVLLAREQGLPVVSVAAWWQEYPVAVVAKIERGIDAPADLVGKRIGFSGGCGGQQIAV